MRALEQIYSIDAPREILNEAREIIERLYEANNEVGGYSHLVPEILDAGRFGELEKIGSTSSIVGSSNPINIIPSDDSKGQCCPTVLAVAKGSKTKTAFKDVAHQLNVHLAKCDRTKLAILLTDRWVPQEFEREFDLIDEHVAKGLVFIPVIAFRDALQIVSYT